MSTNASFGISVCWFRGWTLVLKQAWILFSTTFCLFNTLAAGVWTVSTNASFGISVCRFRWRAPVLKHEWILNCTTSTKSLGKESWRYVDQISPRLLPWYLEFILNSEKRNKYAETVLFATFKQFQSLHWFENFYLISSQVRFKRGESQTYAQITQLHQRYPLVEEFSNSEWVYLSDHSKCSKKATLKASRQKSRLEKRD